ncbi:PREDICTED: protein indeterminate-domain 9-like [Tarenaya hassleriana]|uniref:protein indeterminate-domain 9-like n=1 Tax=Tarenaya hassleriana TaxID=28532 RepID=UPI00053C193A|nr:PREDICTED: protein indeterminate-domain 9-like [Tarenaya hassleriana]
MMMPDDHRHLSFPNFVHQQEPINPNPNPNPPTSTNPSKKRRNLPGTPDPDAEVIALSPNSLMATNRFVCEICNKGFQRDQNLQLHRRGHNLPWKLKQRTNKEQVKKKVYICPEKSCVHHDPARALGDLTGIKKHYSRKHGEKKWKCEKCSKKYAVMSDWKAHCKICGTREYRCDCGILFSRKDSFITHRAFCDALAEESTRFTWVPPSASQNATPPQLDHHTLMGPCLNLSRNTNVFSGQNCTSSCLPDQISPLMNVFGLSSSSSSSSSPSGTSDSLHTLWQLQGQFSHQWPLDGNTNNVFQRGMAKNQEGEIKKGSNISGSSRSLNQTDPSLASLFTPNNNDSDNNNICRSDPYMSATALLQKAAQMGSTRSNSNGSTTALGLMTSTLFSNMHQNSNFPKKQTDPTSKSSQGSPGNMDKGSLPGAREGGSSAREVVDEAGGLTRDFLGVGRHEQDRLQHHLYPSNRPLMLKHDRPDLAPATVGSAAMDMGSTLLK